MQRLVVVALVPLLAFAVAAGGQAADLQGAGAALKALSERQNPAQPPQGKGPIATFRRDLTSFTAAAPSMPPAEAARGWLALYDRYAGLDLTLQEQPADPHGPPRLQDLVAALPPPPAWRALYDGLQRRIPQAGSVKDHGLLLLGALLNDDQAAVNRELTALLPLLRADKRQSGQIVDLQEKLALRSGDPARILAVEQAKLAAFDSNNYALALPDLVTLVGPQRAELLLRKALVVPNALVSVQGAESVRLARRLALEMVAQLKSPQWTLAQSIEGAALYEALERRFAAPKNINAPPGKPGPKRGIEEPFGSYDARDEARVLARLYYFMALVTSGRTADALRLASGLRRSRYGGEHQTLAVLDEAGKPDAVAAFLQAALAKDPSLPLWDLLVTASARAHGSDAALKLMQSTLQRKDLPADVSRSLQRRLYNAYLAADRLDDALAELRKILNDRPVKADGDSEDPARQMVRLGSALGRNDLVEDGLAVMRRDRKDGARRSGYEIADTLVEIGRDADAEKELIEQLRLMAQSSPPGETLNGGSEYLVRLAGIYYRASRWDDILSLLKSAPNWSAGDLSALLFQTDATETYLGQMAATALARSGDRAAALPIVRALLAGKGGGYDPGYELLSELEGERALPFLAELFARDQFEERPLIWKAQILFKAGKLEEAEAAARAAIAIDPSDGEEKHGHRMKVYAVLADIREARGDQKQADLFRGAVKAIRSAEQADVLYQAGLLDRGIKRYEQSLTYFQDAYCIQSRLAVQLASEGEWEKAEEHYRRAFELMPDSFGRMESHCFGCEGVFGGRRAEGIAERVFKDLLVKTPDKPQVYYLLAYLRNTQGRYPEALQMLREAVKRDPDYLNAWKLMLTISRQMRLPSSDADAAALALMRLDPLGRHVQLDISEVTSLRGLWDTFAGLQAVKAPVVPEDLYPLTATAAAQEKSGASRYTRRFYGRNLDRFNRYRGYYGAEAETIPTPGEAVAAHGTIQLALNLIENGLDKFGQGAGRFF